MNKYRLQFTVSVEVAIEVRAESLEAALSKANEIAKDDPVRVGLIGMPKRNEYLWNDDSTVSGVTIA